MTRTGAGTDLASFVAGIPVEAVPPAVRDRLKLGFLTALGAAATVGPRWWLPGPEVTLAEAARRNAVAVHRGEPAADPAGPWAATAAWCVPVTLTVGAGQRRGGAEVLAAAAVGTDLGLRLWTAVGDVLIDRGLDLTTVGTLAATAAAARALGADPTVTGWALGIAACFTPSALLAAWRSGASTADRHLAHATGQGVTAAELAGRGLRGLSDWTTPWFTALAPEADPAPVTAELGGRWLIADLLDPPLVQADSVATRLAALLRQHRIGQAELDSVVVHGGNLFVHAGPEGRLAALVADRLGAESLRPRVQVAGFGDPGRVGMTARTTTGREVSVLAGRDTPATATWSELAETVRHRLVGRLGTDRVEALIELVGRLERLPDAGELTAVLAAPAADGGRVRRPAPAQPAPADPAAVAVAEFAARTRFTDLPPGVVAAVRRSVLDAIGCALYGQSTDTVRLASAYGTRLVGSPPGVGAASVWHSGQPTTVPAAILINGTAIHATELSESFTRAAVHPGTSIVPAMVALAEHQDATGAELVTAIAIGYEVAIRFGLAFGGILLAQGLHSPTLAGAFGVAAGAARLRRLDPVATGHALAVTASRIPTAMWAAAAQHAEVKDLFQAYGAVLALEAVEAAAAGETGPPDWLARWFAAVPRRPRLAGLADTLGHFWWISSGGLHFKDLPVMAMAAPTLGALRQILSRHRVPPAEVARVVVESSGRISLNRAYPPHGLLSARASIPFLVAAILTDPEEFLADRYFLRFLTADRIADRRLDPLAERVELRVDPEFDAHMERAWPLRFEARVNIHLRSGQTLVGYDDTWSRTSTMSYAEVADKFRAMCAEALPPTGRERVIATVGRLDQLTRVREITAMTAAY